MSLDERFAYASDQNSVVSAFALDNGGNVWKQAALKNRQLTAPALLGGALAVGDLDGYVHFLSRSGSLMARLSVGGGAIVSPPQTTSQGVLIQTQWQPCPDRLQLKPIEQKPLPCLSSLSSPWSAAPMWKSTLFNRLTRSRAALVADYSGLTRDRHYGEGRVGEIPFIAIDTGGFEPVARTASCWKWRARPGRPSPRPTWWCSWWTREPASTPMTTRSPNCCAIRPAARAAGGQQGRGHGIRRRRGRVPRTGPGPAVCDFGSARRWHRRPDRAGAEGPGAAGRGRARRGRPARSPHQAGHRRTSQRRQVHAHQHADGRRARHRVRHAGHHARRHRNRLRARRPPLR